MLDKLKDLGELLNEHKKITIIVVVVLIVAMVGYGVYSERRDQAMKEKADAETQKMLEESQKSNIDGSNDNLLMTIQDDLENSFGKAPKGFIWDVDGSLLSLGDKKMSAEEVVYAYMKAVGNLDISTMQRYSRASEVVETYNGYFNDKTKNTDYTDEFIRKMYKACMQSVQVLSVENAGVFADNKKIFTVKCKMLDLTTKDFWRGEQEEIFDKLSLYDDKESDSTKADIYLYDYIIKYYNSGEAKLKTVSFDVTLQKYPDLKSGWLVSVDTDLNNAFQYKDGKLVVSYIQEEYRDQVLGNNE